MVGQLRPELERFASMSILIVDDNQDNLTFASQVLRRAGARHLTMLQDSRRVEGMLADVAPDLVLLDLQMPTPDGHEVLEQIVRFAAGTYLPVLVLTADVSNRARNRALARGARDFMTKPLDVTELTLRVANLLETRMLYQNLLADAEGGRLPASVRETSRARVLALIDRRAVRTELRPVTNLETADVVGFEASARISEPHEQGQAGWLAEAAAVDLLVKLERVVADSATKELPHFESSQFLAVGLSPATVLRLSDQPLAPVNELPRLVVQLTGHQHVQDYAAVRRAMADLRASGVRLAAEDLASGYDGFRHLLALEPDIIKLNVSLVRGIDSSRGQRALATAIQAFATDVGATLVAEGITRREELKVLLDLGVSWGQGDLLGRPAPPTALLMSGEGRASGPM